MMRWRMSGVRIDGSGSDRSSKAMVSFMSGVSRLGSGSSSIGLSSASLMAASGSASPGNGSAG